MTFMDDHSTEIPLTDDPVFGHPGVDRRRLIAAGAVSVLAALAVFFAPRVGLDSGPSRSKPSAAPAAPKNKDMATRHDAAPVEDGDGICDGTLRNLLPEGFCSSETDPSGRGMRPTLGGSPNQAGRADGSAPDGWQRHEISTSG